MNPKLGDIHIHHSIIAIMKFTVATFIATITFTSAFAPSNFGVRNTALNAKIRGPTEKSEELRFGEIKIPKLERMRK